jgi:hypothetical protein
MVYMHSSAPTCDISADLEAIQAWWSTSDRIDSPLAERHFPIAGTCHDQTVPDGIENPYWEIVRHLPHEDSSFLGDGITPYGYPRGLEQMRREKLTKRFAWAIPSPADMAWLTRTLEGRSLVEIAAGSGYWAWQAAQAGIDVVAYEPNTPGDNHYAAGLEYFPLQRADAVTAARQHPDRALLVCWPSYKATWAAEALRVFQGEVLVYIGEHWGGCCADDGFFELLNAEWEEFGGLPDHRTWWGIHCRMSAYRRK